MAGSIPLVSQTGLDADYWHGDELVMKRGNWKTRKAKKRDLGRHRQFIKSEAGMIRLAKPELSQVGKAIKKMASRMGKRGD